MGRLAAYFNTFMEWLEQYSRNLQAEIDRHKRTQEALRQSEEVFFKAFQSSPNAICVTSLASNHFISVNETFLHLSGYSSDEVLGKTPLELNLFTSREDAMTLGGLLEKEEHLRGKAVEMRTKGGGIRVCSLSGERIELRGQPCVLSTLEDNTEWRRLEQEVMNIADGVRQNIGRELHDDLCAHLIGIEVLSKVLSNKENAAIRDDTGLSGKIRSLVADAVEKTRRLARGLCPVHMIESGLESALEDLSDTTETLFGVSCVFECDRPVPIYDNAFATHLFYIAQEAIQNAIKHGRARRITILLLSDHGKITLQITDDGSGIPIPPPETGMGLRIMNYRAKMIHGELTVRPGEERGTVVLCSMRDPLCPAGG
jgi:PAS domain S-box-containing protein